MARKLDELYWDLTARTEGLKREIRDAKERLRELDRTGENTAEGFRDLGEAGSAALNDLGRSARRTGDVLGRSLTASIRASALRIRSEIEEALGRGLITPEQASDLASRAARNLSTEFDRKLRQIRGLGRDIDLVDEATIRSEIRELASAGEKGGREFGDAASRESQSRLQRIEQFIRGGFRAGVVGAMVVVAGQVVQAWRNVAERIQGFLERAGDVQSIRTAFESLSTARGLDPTSLLDRLQAAARGTASSFDLMRTANEAMQAGLPGTEEDLARVLEVSRRLGKSVGTDAEESFRRFVQAIIRGRREILDDIGVVVDFEEAHEALARRLGTTTAALSEEQKVAARLEAALAAAEERVETLGSESFTARERVQQLASATRNYVDAILAGIAESPRFTAQLEFMADAALGTAGALDAVSVQAGATASTIIRTLGNPKVAAALIFAGGPAALADLIRALSGADTNVRSFTRLLFDALGVSDQFTKGTEEMTQALEDRNRALDIRRARTVEALIPIAREVRREVQATNRAFEEGQITREERQRRLNLLQGQAVALARQEELIKGRIAEGDRPRIQFSEAEIKSARARLTELRLSLEELRRTGAEFTLLSDAPAPLREAVQAALELQRDIRQIEQDIETAGGASAEVLDTLARKREQLAEARQRAADIAQTPEGQIAETALVARENLESLLAARERLVALGFEGLADAPPQLLEVFERIGENEESIARIAELTRDLSEEDAALAREAAGLISQLERENDELRELATALGGVGAILTDFPDLEATVFAGLAPEDTAQVRAGLQSVQAALQAVEAARLDVDIARLTGDQERAQEAARRLDQAERRLTQTLARFAQIIQQSNLPLKAKTELLKLLAGLSEDAAESTFDLGKALGTIEGLARGVLSVADAMGVLDDQTRRALQGAIDLAAGIKDIASGNVLGGAAQAIGGAIGLVSGLFGESERERKLRESRENNTIALDRLRSSIDTLRDTLDRVPAEVARSIERLAESTFAIDPADRFFRRRGVGADITTEIAALGLDPEEIEAVARALDQPVDKLLRLLRGFSLSGEDVLIAIQQFESLRQAAIESAGAGNSFAAEIARIRREFELFDINDPIQQLDRLRKKFVEFIELPEDVERAIAEADLTTPEGRKAFEDALRRAFELLATAGGPLSREDAEEFLTEMKRASDALEEAAAADGDALGGPDAIPFEVRRAITEVSANRLIGVLQTIAIHDDRRDAILGEILRALGSGPTISASAFRAPAIPPVVGLTPSGQAPSLSIDFSQTVEVDAASMSPAEIVRAISEDGGRQAVEALLAEINRQMGRELRRDLRSEGRLN